MLFYVTKEHFYLFAAIAVIGEEFADTMASEFGKLSRRQPIDILRFKRITTGISGGVSLFGTFMALIGATFAIFVPYLIVNELLSIKIFALLCGIAFFGTIIDSILGSGVQALFKCKVCNTIMESRSHCGEDAVCVKGIPFISNTMVNLITGLITALISCLILTLII